MKTLQSKKVRITLCAIAVILIVSVLATSLIACTKPVAQETSNNVFFVSDFQKNLDNETLASITKEGATIVDVNTMLSTEGWTLDKNPKEIAAGIYALAVTNYNNLTQAGYLVKTDASVNAYDTSLAGVDVHVGLRSTFSTFTGKNGTFSQTISGVTALEGFGTLGDTIRGLFGYNIQSFTNDEIYAFRRASNGGANFYGEETEGYLKYIMGAENTFPTRYNDKKGNDTKAFYIKDIETYNSENEDGSQTDIEQPEQHERPYAWSPLNGTTTGELEVAGTKYYLGSFGAGFATYNFSEASWLDNATSVTYDSKNDIYRLNIVVAEQYVDDACIYAKGSLIKDTKDYIALKNAKYTECTNVIEVYGNGLIKSIQKIETLATEDKCDLVVISGNCKGGSTTNEAIFAFGYTDECTDANRYAALYWSQLGDESYYGKTANCTKDMVLDLSSYPTFETYEPTVNDMAQYFVSIFTKDSEN